MISNASIHKIKISGGETAPSWAIILAWPAMLLGIGVIMSSHVWGYLILISLCVFFFLCFRAVTAEVDIATKRLMIVSDYFGYWRRTLVYCSFDECKTVGVDISSEGQDLLYIEFWGERRPRYFNVLADESPAHIAASLSNLLGVPRRDIK